MRGANAVYKEMETFFQFPEHVMNRNVVQATVASSMQRIVLSNGRARLCSS